MILIGVVGGHDEWTDYSKFKAVRGVGRYGVPRELSLVVQAFSARQGDTYSYTVSEPRGAMAHAYKLLFYTQVREVRNYGKLHTSSYLL